jgi:hypothetical protein
MPHKHQSIDYFFFFFLVQMASPTITLPVKREKKSGYRICYRINYFPLHCPYPKGTEPIVRSTFDSENESPYLPDNFVA